MKIDEIKIKNFKSIREMDLNLTKINVLIGPNGSGKSNFIAFFEFLNHLIEKDMKTYVAKKGGANNLLFFGRNNSTEIETKIHFGRNRYSCKLEPTDDDNLIFADERTIYIMDDGKEFDDFLGSGHRETNIFEQIESDKRKYAHSRAAWYVSKAFESWKVYHFHDTSSNAKVKLRGSVNDNRFLRQNASNLAAFLYKLREKYPDYYVQIETTIKLIAPFFDRFKLEPLQLDESKILIEWKHVGSDEYFDAQSLSDGTLRMMCLITLILQPNPPDTIIIDEPELGLHPSAITLLASLIKSASINTQIIISTQSVTLIDHFEPNDIIVVERENNASTFRRLNADELEYWREDYSMGEIWEKNIIGGRP